jgi:pyrimidine-nucleoside phosphorylase
MDGSALGIFLDMVEAQGGDIAVFNDLASFHRPGASHVIEAWESGFIQSMDTTALGWAVQRLGAGREKAGERVDAHAGIEFHARRGARVEKGQPLATLYATSAPMLLEPVSLFVNAVAIGPTPPSAPPLVSRIFTRESAEEYLRDAVR